MGEKHQWQKRVRESEDQFANQMLYRHSWITKQKRFVENVGRSD